MALQVSVDEAKTDFSKLLARVREGEEVIIARRGKPIARLVPIKEHPLQRVPGSAKGEVIISPDCISSISLSVPSSMSTIVPAMKQPPPPAHPTLHVGGAVALVTCM